MSEIYLRNTFASLNNFERFSPIFNASFQNPRISFTQDIPILTNNLRNLTCVLDINSYLKLDLTIFVKKT